MPTIELEKGRHRVFNFAISTFDNSLINEKLDLVFNGLKCAAKVNLAFGFVLKNVEDGSCRYFYAHEKNNTFMERLKLVCTPEDLTNLKEKLQKVDIVDLCIRERERESQYQMEVYQTDKSDSFCSATQRCTHGL